VDPTLDPSDLTGWIVFAAVPLLVITATAFTKATVVFGALRVGLGAEAIIPQTAVLAISFVVMAVVMGPAVVAIVEQIEALGGLDAVLAGGPNQWLAALEPLFDFLRRNAAADELAFFSELGGRSTEDPLVAIPGFLTTELTEALMMAVIIILPLVVVDLIVAQVLALIGLINQPTAIVTVPLKLLLFLSVGGWDVVVRGIVGGYA
jgi:flagellar biosynthesis protein FliP